MNNKRQPHSPIYIKRKLNVHDILDHKSVLLLGPRQTGKSSLIAQNLSQHRTYNLLDSDIYLSLSQNPKRLEQEIQQNDTIIIIDEIQRLPELLNEVHLIIEKYGIKFLLTGSSARKLRQGGVNLLGGRARSRTLHPFSYAELTEKFDLIKALNFGLIPSIYFSDSPAEDLRAYTGDYLTQEIASEARVRNIPAFSRFLEVAALCNAQLINTTKISNDAQVPRTTVIEYFQILFDTLLAFEVTGWKKSRKRKPIQKSKFYFFDVGIVRSLQHQNEMGLKTPEAGEAFETYIAHELKTYCDYSGNKELQFWRSTSGFEVDFILNNEHAIEVKCKEVISQTDLKGLKALKEENSLKKYTVVSLEKRPRTVDGIDIVPWQVFLDDLWGQTPLANK